MTQMGQHYFYDLETGYDMTFKTGPLDVHDLCILSLMWQVTSSL